ncbi:enoyl-CoA hydratase/isomerase family protein [Acidicapsa dinghuensis]|uniref:Enoyl-CoA hydratase/isomerase family protein n=1 Tax=Acidicapsa dinghuensis TaxID=2218256 RepID=A0ABW1ECG4_9BACT|nr:enoyl-CoA hydratase-related protein [Acidicapsa dinghuensis]
MEYTTILVSDQGPVRRITLNRPGRHNALTHVLQTELIAALEESVSSACRVVVLHGAGKSFCAGLDLDELQTSANSDGNEAKARAELLARMFRTLHDLLKPTIAAVKGAAIAGGTGLAMVCDYTLATPDAKFGFTEVRIGFVPALVSAYLALQVGDKQARGLLLSGRFFGAAEAYRLGLVHEVVEQGQLTSRVNELAEALARNSPQSLAATKRLLSSQNKAWLDSALTLAIEANAEARETEDFREGIAAFLEKRSPVWMKG